MTRRAGLVALACGLLALSGCAGLGKPWTAPEVELLGVQPRAIAVDGQSFLVALRLRNPNDRTLPVKAMTYRLQLAGQPIADGESALDRLIPPGGTAQADVLVRSDLLALAPWLPQRLLTAEPLDWKLAGTIWIEAAGVRLPLPYRHSGQIDPAALLAGARR